MKKYKAYRVAIKYPMNEHWFCTWREETETFDLDRFVLSREMFKEFDPFKPETNVVFVLWAYDDNSEVGKIVAKTDFFRVWEKWMESVKEVF